MEKPFTAEELEAKLVQATILHYNLCVLGTDIPGVEQLSQASDPGWLARALIKSIAEVWEENNKRMEDLNRQRENTRPRHRKA